MMCLIEGCNHSKSRRMRIIKGDVINPWEEWQICPCCAITLALMKVINYPINTTTTRCNMYLKKELIVEKKPNVIAVRQVKEYRTNKRREFIAKMGY